MRGFQLITEKDDASLESSAKLCFLQRNKKKLCNHKQCNKGKTSCYYKLLSLSSYMSITINDDLIGSSSPITNKEINKSIKQLFIS